MMLGSGSESQLTANQWFTMVNLVCFYIPSCYKMSTHLHAWAVRRCYKFFVRWFGPTVYRWVFLAYFRFFVHSRYRSLIKYMICKYFSHFLGCLFALLVALFEVEISNFNEVQLILIYFTVYAWCTSQEITAKPNDMQFFIYSFL